MNRPETIEETAALVDEAGGRGIAVQVDHLVPERGARAGRAHRATSRARCTSSSTTSGAPPRWSGTRRSGSPSLDVGLRTLRLAVDTHAITSHFALPLLIKTPGGLVVEVTDGTDEYNATNYRVSFFYDLAKAAVNRMAFALAHELRAARRDRRVAHAGLAALGGDARRVRRHRGELAGRHRSVSPHFAISESPAFVGRAVAALAQDPDVARWNGQSLSSGQLAKVYGFTDLDGSQPDAWRYVVEVQDAGKPADVTGYR